MFLKEKQRKEKQSSGTVTAKQVSAFLFLLLFDSSLYKAVSIECRKCCHDCLGLVLLKKSRATFSTNHFPVPNAGFMYLLGVLIGMQMLYDAKLSLS